MTIYAVIRDFSHNETFTASLYAFVKHPLVYVLSPVSEISRGAVFYAARGLVEAHAVIRIIALARHVREWIYICKGVSDFRPSCIHSA